MFRYNIIYIRFNLVISIFMFFVRAVGHNKYIKNLKLIPPKCYIISDKVQHTATRAVRVPKNRPIKILVDFIAV